MRSLPVHSMNTYLLEYDIYSRCRYIIYTRNRVHMSSAGARSSYTRMGATHPTHAQPTRAQYERLFTWLSCVSYIYIYVYIVYTRNRVQLLLAAVHS